MSSPEEHGKGSKLPPVPPPLFPWGPDGESIVEDVLPSFDMHSLILNRSMRETQSLPPNYDESNSPAPEHPYAEDDDPSTFILNNLERLKRVEDLPVEFKVYLTQKMPELGRPLSYTRENLLREYMPGDRVTGYITMCNVGKKPIPFDMFLVSLQGKVGVPRWGKVPGFKVATFLKTYDLEASFSPYSGSAITVHGIQQACEVDPSDGMYYGFEADQIMWPGRIHKKHFTFIMPRYLLETVCPHRITPHLCLPTSFGVDSCVYYGSAGVVDSSDPDPSVGYTAYGDTLGSPIRAIDYAVRNAFVGFSIHVQMIGNRAEKGSTGPDFRVFKEVDCHFRVNTSGSMEVNNMGSTKQQLDTLDSQLDTLVRDLIHSVYPEDPARTEVTEEEGKLKAQRLVRESLQNTQSVDELKHYLYYEARGTSVITKGLFSKVIGKLGFSVKAPRGLSINSLRPSCFLTMQSSGNIANDNSVSGSSTAVGQSLFSNVSDSEVSNSLTSSKQGSAMMRNGSDLIYIEFEFTTDDIKRKPPSTIDIHLSLEAVDLFSDRSFPVSFDDDFVQSYDEKHKKDMKSKYESVVKLMADLYKESPTMVPSLPLLSALSLANMQGCNRDYTSFFEKVAVAPRWVFDVSSKSYRASVEIPLRISDNAIKEKYYVPPNFETCYLGRWYRLSVRIGKETVKVPIRVV